MKLEDIEKIISIFENTNASKLDLEVDDIKLKLEKNIISKKPIKNASNENVKKEEKTKAIVSTVVGTYYSSSKVNGEPFVKVGSKVKKNDKLCIVESMKVLNQYCAPFDGIVKEIFINNGQMVQYGQKLMVIERNEDKK